MFKKNLDNKEPENPVVYLSNLVKKIRCKEQKWFSSLSNSKPSSDSFI